ncbi:unnamed protein product [Gongylonema pulchrum]|uniref:Uncharacterized protein n=1 Tax=Gongylonema pulchrum TaxID=637853 RepID=A0A183F0G0_9BILA|nr:unnamed protein product [Gongylonema pulchrum]VDN48561.1 unnamed protein product [Gongylonema pulchrum]
MVGAPLGAFLFKLFIGLHETNDFDISGISYTYPYPPAIKPIQSIVPPVLTGKQQQQQQQTDQKAALTILVD